MRLLVIDCNGRALINATIDIANDTCYPPPNPFSHRFLSSCSPPSPSPAPAPPAHHHTYREFDSALADADPAADPQYFLSKIQVALAYLGTACLSRLVDRMNGVLRDGRYARSAMEERKIADELTQAMVHVNNAYKWVKPYSTNAANSLAKISNDLRSAYSKVRDGGNDPFAKFEVDLAPHNSLEGAERPQPEGLASTFFRQRPKESWVDTNLRVFSEDGYYSLLELRDTDPAASRKAAAEAIRIKKASDGLNIKALETIANVYHETQQKSLDAPRLSVYTNLASIDTNPVGFREVVKGRSGLASPLRAEAEPFRPGAARPANNIASNIFAALDNNSSSRDSESPNGSGQSSTSHRISAASHLLAGLGQGVDNLNPYSYLASTAAQALHRTPQHKVQTAQKPELLPIGHERAQSKTFGAHLLLNKSPRADLLDSWEDASLPEGGPSETSHHSTTSRVPVENNERAPTPLPKADHKLEQTQQWEINGPDSPAYRTWAQKLAVNSEEEGWEKVGGKGRKAAQPVAIKQTVAPTSISHRTARYVIVAGCRAGTTLSEITSQIDQVGPLVSVRLEKKASDGSITAHILFVFGSHAVDFLGNNQYHVQHRGESLYGPGVSVSLGPGYEGSLLDLRGMSVPLNQSGRSDAGAHFERRRITFAGNGLAMTELKLRNAFIKVVGIPESEIEVIVVFNPGNATAILASVFSARKIKEKLGLEKSGGWRACKIMYSSDPCEKTLSFMDKIRREAQSGRAEIVRRAYQRAGKVNC